MNCHLHIGTKHSAISVSDILPSSFHVYFISYSTQSQAMSLSNLIYSLRLHAYQMVSVSLFQCFLSMFHTLYVAVSFACCFLSLVFNFILTEIARKRAKRVGIYRWVSGYHEIIHRHSDTSHTLSSSQMSSTQFPSHSQLRCVDLNYRNEHYHSSHTAITENSHIKVMIFVQILRHIDEFIENKLYSWKIICKIAKWYEDI